jgi:HK97 family phage major capsid protein
MNELTKQIKEKEATVESTRGELDKLISRKSDLQVKLAHHRDNLDGKPETTRAIEEVTNNLIENQKQIIEKRESIITLREEINKLKYEEVLEQVQQSQQARATSINGMLNFRKDMQHSEDIRSTEEYRSAFYKQLRATKNNKPAFTEAEREALEKYNELKAVEERDMTTGAGVGGSAVPTTTMDKIIDKLEQTNLLYPYITKTSIRGLLKLPKENVVDDAAWVAEGTDVSDGTNTLTEINFAAHELIKTITITAHLRAMSVSDLENWIVRALSRKLSKAIENAILNGTGSANNQPDGILASVSWVDDTNQHTTPTTTLTYGDILKFLALLPIEYETNNTFLVINKKTLFTDFLAVKDDVNRPIFDPRRAKGEFYNVMGYSVLPSAYIPVKRALLGDLSNYHMNWNSPIAIESDDSVKFTSAKRVYRGMGLVDGKVVNSQAFVRLVIAV